MIGGNRLVAAGEMKVWNVSDPESKIGSISRKREVQKGRCNLIWKGNRHDEIL